MNVHPEFIHMFYLLCKQFLADCRYQYFGENIFFFPQHTINIVVFKNVNTEELQHKSKSTTPAPHVGLKDYKNDMQLK